MGPDSARLVGKQAQPQSHLLACTARLGTAGTYTVKRLSHPGCGTTSVQLCKLVHINTQHSRLIGSKGNQKCNMTLGSSISPSPWGGVGLGDAELKAALDSAGD